MYICLLCRCSNTNLEGVVSEILSALLKQLTDLERHEEDLRACQSTTEKVSMIMRYICISKVYISALRIRKQQLRTFYIFNSSLRIVAAVL